MPVSYMAKPVLTTPHGNAVSLDKTVKLAMKNVYTVRRTEQLIMLGFACNSSDLLGFWNHQYLDFQDFWQP